MNELPTPQRGQVWRSRVTGFAHEVLDDRRVNKGWVALTDDTRGGQWVGVYDLHNGNFEPPRPEIPTYWVNVYAVGCPSVAERSARNADRVATTDRICRVPLVPDWDSAVYDDV